MKKLPLALLFAACCAGLWAAAPEARPASRPFFISSISSDFPKSVELKGELRILPDAIELKVHECELRLKEWPNYTGRSAVTDLSVGLAANNAEGRWVPLKPVTLYAVDKILRPGAVLQLGPGLVRIPIDPSLDLAKHWLIIHIESIAIDVPTTERTTGFSYAHSDHAIFAAPGR